MTTQSALQRDDELAEPMQAIRLALGSMVLRAGRVEGSVWAIARNLNIEPANTPMKDVMWAIRKVMKDHGLPPWSSGVSVGRITRWLQRTTEVLQRRHTIIHSSWSYELKTTGEWSPIVTLSSSGVTRQSLDLHTVSTLVDDLDELEREANGPSGISNRLNRPIEPYGSMAPTSVTTSDQGTWNRQYAESFGGNEHYIGLPKTIPELKPRKPQP